MMSEKKSEVDEVNPVWARFCQVQIDGWVLFVESNGVLAFKDLHVEWFHSLFGCHHQGCLILTRTT